MCRATLVGIVSSLSILREANGSDLKLADWLEIRADLMPGTDSNAFRRNFDGRLLYSLRSRRGGGRDDSAIESRHRHLQDASLAYDLVNLEADRDLVPKLLRRISPDRRVISWHGSVADQQALQRLLRILSRNSARLYRFEIACTTVEDGIIALQFLKEAKRSDVIAYAIGPLGVWTRVLAPRLGSPIVFGGLQDECQAGDGHPSLSELIKDYGFPDIDPVSEIFAIVGEPVSGSLSPRLHNAAHRTSGHGRVFLSFPTRGFHRFWNRLVSSGDLEAIGLTINGLTVASPNKESALEVTGRAAPLCHHCIATNLVVRQNGGWTACTTDPDGIFRHEIFQRINLRRTKVAVVGCGGSGRVTAAALSQAGAEVTLVNRGSDRGMWAGRLLGLPFLPLPEFSLRGYSAMVNATPVGREGEELPVDLKSLDAGSLVVDLVYRREGPTQLVETSRALGHKVIEGRNVLLAQTMQQYGLMTGEEMLEGVARGLLGIPMEDAGATKSFHPNRNNGHQMAG
jgi:3-dehydroquinate dehydratase / shikimate dehydrogenase